MGGNTDTSNQGLNRRSVIKRAAVVGAATAWATPTIQSIASPAFAAGSPAGRCTSCITGGGNNIVNNGTWNGNALEKITLGMGQICCEYNGPPGNKNEVTIVLHPVDKKIKDQQFQFTDNLQITCVRTGSPAPAPGTESCANRFTGTLNDDLGNTLSFVFEDNGEPGQNVDYISVSLTGPGLNASGAGLLARGNLQVHAGLGPIERDCSGCPQA